MQRHRPSILHRPLRTESKATIENGPLEFQREQEKLAAKQALAAATHERINKSLYPTPEDRIASSMDTQQFLEEHRAARMKDRCAQEEWEAKWVGQGVAAPAAAKVVAVAEDRPWQNPSYMYRDAREERLARLHHEEEVAAHNKATAAEAALRRSAAAAQEQEEAQRVLQTQNFWNAPANPRVPQKQAQPRSNVSAPPPYAVSDNDTYGYASGTEYAHQSRPVAQDASRRTTQATTGAPYHSETGARLGFGGDDVQSTRSRTQDITGVQRQFEQHMRLDGAEKANSVRAAPFATNLDVPAARHAVATHAGSRYGCRPESANATGQSNLPWATNYGEKEVRPKYSASVYENNNSYGDAQSQYSYAQRPEMYDNQSEYARSEYDCSVSSRPGTAMSERSYQAGGAQARADEGPSSRAPPHWQTASNQHFPQRAQAPKSTMQDLLYGGGYNATGQGSSMPPSRPGTVASSRRSTMAEILGGGGY